MFFCNREDAGKKLAAALKRFKGLDCVVLALPRGGVPVAAPVATILEVPLDLLLVQKICAPGRGDLAIGAVIDGGRVPIIIRDNGLIRLTGTSSREFDRLCLLELAEIELRRKFYLGTTPPLGLKGRIAIVVDDGVVTGTTMRAALQAVRLREPATVVMAVPVAPEKALEELRAEADEIVCLATPEPFSSIGSVYHEFQSTSDAEVIQLMMAHSLNCDRDTCV